MTLSKASICLVVALGLSGCAAHSPDDVSIETTQQFAYRHDGPPALTLYTMVSNRSGSGAHSSRVSPGANCSRIGSIATPVASSTQIAPAAALIAPTLSAGPAGHWPRR